MSLCRKLKYFWILKFLQPGSVKLCYFRHILFDSQFEIPKIYKIELKNIGYQIFRVSWKNTFSFCDITGATFWPCRFFSFTHKHEKNKCVWLLTRNSIDGYSTEESYKIENITDFSLTWNLLKWRDLILL